MHNSVMGAVSVKSASETLADGIGYLATRDLLARPIVGLDLAAGTDTAEVLATNLP